MEIETEFFKNFGPNFRLKVGLQLSFLFDILLYEFFSVFLLFFSSDRAFTAELDLQPATAIVMGDKLINRSECCRKVLRRN